MNYLTIRVMELSISSITLIKSQPKITYHQIKTFYMQEKQPKESQNTLSILITFHLNLLMSEVKDHNDKNGFSVSKVSHQYCF